MGCWNETCIITNLPILSDSEVIAFESKNVQEMLDFLENPIFCYHVNIAEGKMGWYGDLEEVNILHQKEGTHPKFSYKGTNRYLAFCYKDVFYKLVKYVKDTGFIGNNLVFGHFATPPSQIVKDFHLFGMFMRKSRAGFPENIFRGSQSLDVHYRSLLAQWTIDKAHVIEKKLKEQEEE